MAWSNAASGVGIPSNNPRLYSSVPVSVEYQGFEMAGLGYVLAVTLAALWAGSEYGTGQQVRTIAGGLVQASWAIVFLIAARIAFTRRDR